MLNVVTRIFLAICTVLGGVGLSSVEFVVAAEAKPAWQLDWEKTIKAAEQEGAVTIYMCPVFFQ